MHNNTGKSAEVTVTFRREEAPIVEGHWYSVRNVAVPSIQEKLSLILDAESEEQFRPNVNVEVSSAVASSTVDQLSAHEQALEKIRQDIEGKY